MTAEWFDYVAGSATVAAAVFAGVSIQYARKASRDVIADRRATHELDILVRIRELATRWPQDFASLALWRDALPPQTLPALDDWIAGVGRQVAEDAGQGSEYAKQMELRVVAQVDTAIRKRTTPPLGAWGQLRGRFAHESAGEQRQSNAAPGETPTAQ